MVDGPRFSNDRKSWAADVDRVISEAQQPHQTSFSPLPPPPPPLPPLADGKVTGKAVRDWAFSRDDEEEGRAARRDQQQPVPPIAYFVAILVFVVFFMLP